MNNNGICTIEMNGEQIALKFGLPACRFFLEKVSQGHVKPLSGDSVNEVGAAYLIYAGYYNHCIISDAAPVKKFSDFMDWIESGLGDELLKKQLADVAECYKNSTTVKKYLELAEKEVDELKKKTKQLTGTLSSRSATEKSA
jgi:hypothetical protein